LIERFRATAKPEALNRKFEKHDPNSYIFTAGMPVIKNEG